LTCNFKFANYNADKIFENFMKYHRPAIFILHYAKILKENVAVENDLFCNKYFILENFLQFTQLKLKMLLHAL
jgi:hypothetical protein